MPAYNPPPQTLFSPVSNHYQGKAIRAGLAAQEQNAELRGLQIESTKQELANAPEKWAMAKQNAQSQQEAFDLSIAKSKRDGRWESMLRSSKIMIPWVQDIGAMAGADGENSEAAMQKANETLPSVIEQLSGVVDPDELEKLNQFAGEDRVLDANEFMMLGKYLESFMTADKKDSYTLAPGAKRYKDGVEVASNPKDANSESRSARYKQAVDGGLEPGTEEFNEYVLNAGGDEGRQRDDEIRDTTKILTDMGVSNAETEAIKQVDGKIIYTVDPNGGTIYRTDKITNKTEEVAIQGGERGPAPEIKYEDTLHGMVDEATGLGPGVKAAVAAGIGPLGLYTAEATTKARAKFKAAENTLIRAFSLNPRYPVAEQKRVTDNIQIQPNFWDSSPQMRARMAGIRSFLEQERDTAAWESTRPGIGRKQKTVEDNTVADINRFLATLGKAPEPVPELSDLPPVPEGVTPEEWRHMDEDKRSLWD